MVRAAGSLSPGSSTTPHHAMRHALRHALRHAAAAAAAVLLAPLAARAQAPSPALGTYAISGCVDGVVRYEPGRVPSPFVPGRPACFTGAATYSIATFGGGGPFPRFEGALTATFSPEFTGQFLAVTGSDLFYRYGEAGCEPTCPSGGGPFGFVGNSFGNAGGTSTLAFRTGFPGRLPSGGSSALPNAAAFLFLQWQLPNDQPGDSYLGAANLVFTPIPEPATVALTAAGLLAVGGAGWRRRRPLG
jgi:hypothetical protein